MLPISLSPDSILSLSLTHSHRCSKRRRRRNDRRRREVYRFLQSMRAHRGLGPLREGLRRPTRVTKSIHTCVFDFFFLYLKEDDVLPDCSETMIYWSFYFSFLKKHWTILWKIDWLWSVFIVRWSNHLYMTYHKIMYVFLGRTHLFISITLLSHKIMYICSLFYNIICYC